MTLTSVAVLITTHPKLRTFANAIEAVPGLMDELATAQSITIAAPSDGAFEKLPEPDVRSLLQHPDQLAVVLRRHMSYAPPADAIVEPAVQASNGSMIVINRVLTG